MVYPKTLVWVQFWHADGRYLPPEAGVQGGPGWRLHTTSGTFHLTELSVACPPAALDQSPPPSSKYGFAKAWSRWFPLLQYPNATMPRRIKDGAENR
jgi:hypothetical protein